MKLLITAVLILSLPFAALSETASKTKAKAKAKAKVKQPVVAEQTTHADQGDAPLTAAQLALIPQVYVGHQPCEAGVSVTLTPDPKSAGYFHVSVKNHTYHMFPVVTSSGAVRLEDKTEGAIWLQMSNKSMMMNQKLGLRLADDCINPAQAAVALAMKKNPTPGILDAVK
ncbi:MAG: hypothetical protein Q7K57_07870 [Burkholderiaceae bacterium]|nr:hypothetical protein [Burkholderiaceae bacterium]